MGQTPMWCGFNGISTSTASTSLTLHVPVRVIPSHWQGFCGTCAVCTQTRGGSCQTGAPGRCPGKRFSTRQRTCTTCCTLPRCRLVRCSTSRHPKAMLHLSPLDPSTQRVASQDSQCLRPAPSDKKQSSLLLCMAGQKEISQRVQKSLQVVQLTSATATATTVKVQLLMTNLTMPKVVAEQTYHRPNSAPGSDRSESRCECTGSRNKRPPHWLRRSLCSAVAVGRAPHLVGP
mmetsp:Transcript_5572/g.15966  ORF Transcript_5572/g.15966 Transcript_5572/m.15966 type:complete len:232 (+) Transcript_5572:731-1426(+)